MSFKVEEGGFKVYLGTNSKALKEAAFKLVGKY